MNEKLNDNNKNIENGETIDKNLISECEAADENIPVEQHEDLKNEMNELKTKLEELRSKYDECFSMLQRVAADFDNYKKRVQREKENWERDAICEVVALFLPILDNLERAIKAAEQECDFKSILEGVKMVYSQFNEVLRNLGVEPIICEGEKFDPNFHEALIHIKDDAYDENVVVEELRKGYIKDNKVIRHSAVKVAN